MIKLWRPENFGLVAVAKKMIIGLFLDSNHLWIQLQNSKRIAIVGHTFQ